MRTLVAVAVATLAAASFVTGATLTVRQVLERMQRARIERQSLALAATRDPLTGLLNRPELERRLADALAAGQDEASLTGVLFCDLDRFGEVNKTHGHDTGDLLLAAAALRISSVVRPSDIVGRRGGDEFVVICPNLPASPTEAGEALAAIEARVTKAVSQPLMVGNRRVTMGISVGAATSRTGEHEADEAQRLMQRADESMRGSKQRSAI